VSDPVVSGIVPRLDRPGGNVTGFVNLEATLAGKWVELLSEIAPGLKRVAIMFNPAARLNLPPSEDACMISQQDVENYGEELIDMSRRAAVEALGPELNALRQENQHLRHLTARSQRADIERALDQHVPDWRSIYA
jgi:hypothetical protein